MVRAIIDVATLARQLPAAHAINDVDVDALRRIRLRDGRTLAYYEYGPKLGQPLIAFHIWLGGAAMIPGTNALAHKHKLRLIVPERPGYGHSDPTDEFGVWPFARDVEELLDHLGLERVKLLAVAAGAPFALGAAAHLRDRVRHVMLVTPRRPGREPGNMRQQTWRRFRQYLVRFPGLAAGVMEINARIMTRDGVARTVQRIIDQSQVDIDYFRANPGLKDFLVDQSYFAVRHGGKGVAGELQYTARNEAIDFDRVTQPVTVWHDEDDGVVPKEPFLEYVAGRENVTVRINPVSAHFMVYREWADILAHIAAQDQ